jgi:hypothetical protein
MMGMDGYCLEDYLDIIRKYSEQPDGEPEGALIIFADDAEYVGTNGWFRLKYQNKPDNVFEQTPESRQKLIDLIEGCLSMGTFCTYADACSLPALEEELTFDNDSAWHGARASTWASTPMAKLLRPWQDLVREKLKASAGLSPEGQDQAWYHLTNSFNSDGQWPPTLPDAPHIIHPFNYRYCFENLLRAELLVGGVDRSRLDVSPVDTLKAILWPQQDLVLAKAAKLLETGSDDEKADARRATELIETARNLDSLVAGGTRILHPAEYTVRADALVEARRLVGGVVIEK